VLGGPGADRVTSGGSADELSGGEGNDALDGGAGDDVVSGDQGVDTLAGGPGSDRIAARDGEADSVNCGDGADTVDADTVDRVAADCENVAREFTAAPVTGAEDGRPPRLEVGAPVLQRLGRSRVVRVYATSSERGAVSASGGLTIGGLTLPVKTIDRERIRVGGGGAALTYRVRGRHWREARRAFRRGRKVTLRLGVVATDRAGLSTERKAPAIRLLEGRGSSSAGGAVLARAAHPEPGDRDGDGDWDWADNCPDHKNGSQANADGDAQGDACDADDDGDGFADGNDNCRLVANPGQENGNDEYPEYGDACPPKHSDSPSDNIIDEDDNCDIVWNPDQADNDGDDFGDACDADLDGDGFDNGYDNCPTVYNIDPTDTDGDGFVNDQQDIDRDGIGTACDPDETLVGGPSGGSGRATDRKKPRLAVRVTRRQRIPAVKAGLVVMLRCSEACDATVELEVRRRDARRLGLRRGRVLAGGSARLQGKGTTYAFVRFDRRAREKLFRMKSLRPSLTVVAVDRTGNRKRLGLRILLVR
jgi:Thrombospondin type 3 repeat/RTX calcium-binding nonapeptide repeat (4 copies)